MPRAKRTSHLCTAVKAVYNKIKWIIQYYTDEETLKSFKLSVERNKEQEVKSTISKVYALIPTSKLNQPGYCEITDIWHKIEEHGQD